MKEHEGDDTPVQRRPEQNTSTFSSNQTTHKGDSVVTTERRFADGSLPVIRQAAHHMNRKTSKRRMNSTTLDVQNSRNVTTHRKAVGNNSSNLSPIRGSY